VNSYYQEGRDAHHWGKSVDDNPYFDAAVGGHNTEFLRYINWLDGYLDAQYEGMYD